MRELFIDSETTGFVNPRLPLDDEKQPHLVQLAMILREDGKEIGHANYIVRCPVPVPEKAFQVHGIDQEKTQRIGTSPATVCRAFGEWATIADMIIAHNADFDREVMQIALARTSTPIPWTIGQVLDRAKSWVCTMKMAEPHCRIPASEKQIRAGFKRRGDFKQPKLEEALKILLGEDLESAHDALADVRACAKVYDWLVSRDKAA